MRRIKKGIAIIVSAMALIACAHAGGSKDNPRTKNFAPKSEQTKTEIDSFVDINSVTEGQTVSVTGTVRVVGNDPFPERVLSDTKGQTWYIDADSVDCVRQYEQHRITVRGVIRVKQQLLANGTRLPDRVMLTEVLVIE